MKQLIAMAALLATGAAQAYTITPLGPGGHEVDTSFSSASMLSVDYGFKAPGSASLRIGVEASDGPVLSFNALSRNLIGLGIHTITLDLDGSWFTSLGTAQGSFGSVASVTGTPTTASIQLAPAEHFQVTLGDWYLDGNGTDFGIAMSGLRRDSFVLVASVAAVPEPETYALMLLGLAGISAVNRLRRSRRG